MAFAQENSIDLASAYSVLLGLLPRERALSTVTDEPSRRDPGFDSAVAEGFLTSRMALERGDRVFYASRVALQHGLSMNLAFLVADNRISIGQARRRAREERSKDPQAAQAAAPFPWGIVLLVATVAVFLCTVGFLTAFMDTDARLKFGRRAPVAGRPAPRIDVGSQLRQDGEGNLVEVEASTPLAVLEAFCAARPGRRLVRLTPRPDGAWNGTYEERSDSKTIEIRVTETGAVWSEVPPAMPAVQEIVPATAPEPEAEPGPVLEPEPPTETVEPEAQFAVRE